MDYSKMSDFEINKRVFTALRGTKPLGYPHNADGRSVGNESNNQYTWYDYCNNPADAWPIILSSKIGLTPPMHDENWEAMTFDRGGYVNKNEYDKNPLRAAMVVFLMMQESANVQTDSTR